MPYQHLAMSLNCPCWGLSAASGLEKGFLGISRPELGQERDKRIYCLLGFRSVRPDFSASSYVLCVACSVCVCARSCPCITVTVFAVIITACLSWLGPHLQRDPSCSLSAPLCPSWTQPSGFSENQT